MKGIFDKEVDKIFAIFFLLLFAGIRRQIMKTKLVKFARLLSENGFIGKKYPVDVKIHRPN